MKALCKKQTDMHAVIYTVTFESCTCTCIFKQARYIWSNGVCHH